jgi:Protein of unknown function (DUF3147)
VKYMTVKFDISGLTKTKWYEYALRILFGGATTVITGVLAKRYGPVFGGLFLAFPAIFPASATLVEKHETQKKEKAHIFNSIRGREAAALDARGAAMGSIGLAAFACVVWKFVPVWNSAFALIAATIVWLSLSVSIWWLRKRLRGHA